MTREEIMKTILAILILCPVLAFCQVKDNRYTELFRQADSAFNQQTDLLRYQHICNLIDDTTMITMRKDQALLLYFNGYLNGFLYSESYNYNFNLAKLKEDIEYLIIKLK